MTEPRIATVADLQTLYDDLFNYSNASTRYYAPAYRVKNLESDIVWLSVSVILVSISILLIIKRLEALENVA